MRWPRVVIVGLCLVRASLAWAVAPLPIAVASGDNISVGAINIVINLATLAAIGVFAWKISGVWALTRSDLIHARADLDALQARLDKLVPAGQIVEWREEMRRDQRDIEGRIGQLEQALYRRGGQ
jgi:hypothetical protein